MLPVAQIVAATEAEGPGRRFALWVQGCPLRCPGCCNPEMLRFEGGQLTDPVELAERIIRTSGIEGVSFLGGEPFAHAAALSVVAQRVRQAGLSVMIYSGYPLSDLRAREDAAALLAECDLLVDGPYLRDQPERRRRWIGSTNQKIWFLTDRYRSDDPRFLEPNTVEIRLTREELVVNGWPALARALAPRR
jgi:anaerobic ribonucleoside-triphosphate reductase activating protein